MKFVIWTAAVFVAAAVLIYVVIVFTGWYPVGAGEAGPVEWTLDKTAERSIEHHAAGIEAVNVTDPRQLQEGFAEYHQACETCHGAPGAKRAEFAEHLDPKPPDPKEIARDLRPSEIFWTAKNGLQMTGMPAFGAIEPDARLWAVATVMKTLPAISPEEYARRTAHGS